MIYAELTTHQEQSSFVGGKPKSSIRIVFYGEPEAEKYWSNKISDNNTEISKKRDVNKQDILRFFAENDWCWSGGFSFYKK